jgi:complex III assembly factor LYRM7
MPIARAEVFSAYRHLLRSIAIAFHGDQATLSAARQEARRRFEEQRHLNPESAEAMEALTEAQSVGRFLRQNLVQGVKAEGEERYRTNSGIL